MIIIFLLLALNASAYADQPTPEDFAYILPLKTETEAAIYEITLPESVYRHVTRADLGDVRVFDRQGKSVPYLLRRPEIASQTIPPAVLPFFPLHAEGQGSEFSFSLSSDGRGSILSIRSKSGSPQTGNITAYIIDASATDRAIGEIEAEWRNDGDSFVTTVSVESGDDLTHWQTMVSAATLAKLKFGEHRLEQNRIVLPLRKAKYLRISWNAGRKGAELTSLKALFSPVSSEPDRLAITVSGKAAKDKPNAYEFDIPGLFPTDRLNPILPQRNSLAQIVSKSRSNPKEEWKLRHRGVFYNLMTEGGSLKNIPVSFHTVIPDRYWRLETDESGGGIPMLEISWIPHDLVFLARGEPPFSLAYGSSKIGPPGGAMDKLLESIGKDGNPIMKKAYPGTETESGGTNMLRPQAPPFPWKKFLLWAVLVGGVMVLAWMSWLLYRQMNSGDSE